MSLKRTASRRRNLVKKLFDAQQGKCYWCRIQLDLESRENQKHQDNTATFEHLLPRDKQGKDIVKNIVLSCHKCNKIRKNKLSCPQVVNISRSGRPCNPGAESLLNLYFPVLDYGFISLKDYMGTDQCIEQMARVSYGHGTRQSGDTQKLIRFLMRHHHSTPFEGAEMKFHIAMPIFVARQWIRHRTASVNEYSGRYSTMPMLFYTPEALSSQSATNKQGRDNNQTDEELYHKYVDRIDNHRDGVGDLYSDMLNENFTRELCRIELPLSVYTYWYWKCDLRNLLHFLSLRCDSHAQWEIRQYANIMAGMVKLAFPYTFQAWLDYQFVSRNFSKLEFQTLINISQSNSYDEAEKCILESKLDKREQEEFRNKVKHLSLPKNVENVFTLDLLSTKTPQYFETIINEHGIERVAT